MGARPHWLYCPLFTNRMHTYLCCCIALPQQSFRHSLVLNSQVLDLWLTYWNGTDWPSSQPTRKLTKVEVLHKCKTSVSILNHHWIWNILDLRLSRRLRLIKFSWTKFSLRMRTEMVLSTFNHLMRLETRENFINETYCWSWEINPYEL
jgi:hypothetical protein